MKLLILNGSPKLGKSNTAVLLESFIDGFKENSENEVEIYRMNHQMSYKEAAQLFLDAEAVLVAFPLYSYAMPATVKSLFEELEPLIGKCEGKKLGFLVQYGFVEAVHARPLEKYLEYFSKLLNSEYVGTIIKGGCDGLTKRPDANRKVLKGAFEIGKFFGAEGYFDKAMVDKYSAPEVQKKQNMFLFKIIIKMINKFYWENSLKKNGVTLKDSFAKPYGN